MKKYFHLNLPRARMFLLCLAFCGVGSIIAAPGDGHWDRQFGLSGVTNRAYALRANGNKLYASGLAIGAGGIVATNTGVDIFDGTNWNTAIGELTGGTCYIYDIGFLRNDIYVAGIFSRVNGISSPGLAKWNGSDWSNIGFAGNAFALVSDGTNLYVGGAFTNAGGVLNTNIARYDGTNWYSLGGSIGYYDGINSYVYALELHNGQLYAGGVFTNAGAIAATNVAVWNGASWSSLGAGPANGVNNTVYALAFQGNDLYVAGSFSVAGGVSANEIAKWDGSSWSALGAGCKGGNVSCIGILGSDIYVGGGFTNVGGVRASAFAKWDGVSWTTWPATDGQYQYPFSDAPNRMTVQGGSLYIGGMFTLAGGITVNHVARYDGSKFYAVGAKPANGIGTPTLNVSCIGQADDGIYIGGLLTAAGKTQANRIARWDGTNWSSVGGGTMGGAGTANRVLAIAGTGADVYVGGAFTNVGGINVSNIAHWDGANWWNMGNGFDASVSVLAATAGAVYAGGIFTNVIGPPATLTVNHIAMWDGFSWYSLGSGVNSSGNVNAIAVSGTKVYVGGGFTNASGVTASRIAVWDGANWSSLGTGSANGVNGTVLAIAVNGTDVYVGGTFTTAGTISVGGIARWDGANWSGLGTGATSPEIRALAFGGDGKLYCCGRFTNMSGINANNIARWDGAKWEALGSGLSAQSSIIRAVGLAIRGNDVFTAGAFDAAGLTDSGGIARWNETMNFTPPLTMNFSRTQLLPGSLLKSRITCSDRLTYAIDYSDDLQTWTALLTNSAMQLDFTNTVSQSVKRRVFRTRGIP
jgi:hypothetical protein